MSEPVAHPKLTLTGDIGSGKSAVSYLLAEKTGYRRYSTGDLQRQIAERHGMTTLQLNHYSETHPEIDEEIDSATTELGRRDESFIVDSRLAWNFIPHAYKVYLSVAPEIAARRILGDRGRTGESYDDLETAVRDIRARRESEVERFKDIYDIDLADLANFDLVVETSERTVEEVADMVLARFREWASGGGADPRED